MMLKYSLTLSFLFIIGVSFSPHVGIAQTAIKFPTPDWTPRMLYYLQRTTNTNTIVYELNMDKDSVLNKETPIHVYWIRYEEDGHIEELSYIQKHYAYGVEAEPIGKDNYKFHFVSYKKVDLLLSKSKDDGRYHAYISLHNKTTRIEKIFVCIEGGTFWIPNVKYIEITGIDTDTGKPVIRKIIP